MREEREGEVALYITHSEARGLLILEEKEERETQGRREREEGLSGRRAECNSWLNQTTPSPSI